MCAGANDDDKTFDWLKEDDHIISSHDLQFLQQHGHSQIQTDIQDPQKTTQKPKSAPSRQRISRQRKRKQNNSNQIDPSDLALIETASKERRRRRNESKARFRENLKQNDPEAYKQFKDKLNRKELNRLWNLTPEKKQARKQLLKANRDRKTLARLGYIPTPPTAEEKQRKHRERNIRYKENLAQKIKDNRATDEQKKSYIHQFGQKSFRSLMSD